MCTTACAACSSRGWTWSGASTSMGGVGVGRGGGLAGWGRVCGWLAGWLAGWQAGWLVGACIRYVHVMHACPCVQVQRLAGRQTRADRPTTPAAAAAAAAARWHSRESDSHSTPPGAAAGLSWRAWRRSSPRLSACTLCCGCSCWCVSRSQGAALLRRLSRADCRLDGWLV